MSKREQGSGSYRKRGKNAWQLTIRDRDGHRVTKTVKATSEAEVRRMLRAFVASVDRHEVPKAKQKPTVAQVADMWLAHKMRIKRDLAEATIDNLEWAIGHIKRRWGRRKVATIVHGHQVEELFAELMDDGLGRKSIKEVSSALHGILHSSHSRDYVHLDEAPLDGDWQKSWQNFKLWERNWHEKNPKSGTPPLVTERIEASLTDEERAVIERLQILENPPNRDS